MLVPWTRSSTIGSLPICSLPGPMQHTSNGATGSRVGRALASVARRPAATTFYYLVILLALLILYGRGDFSTAGFIYQVF